MKPTQVLDALRNIRKELVAYISIVMIGMMAAMAFLSVSYSAATLKKDALRFFNDNALWDLELASSMLLDEEDLAAVRALPGVRTAEPVYQVNTRLLLGSGKVNVTVLSVPEQISVPVLLEGRLPETAAECAVEKELLDAQGLSLGQTIELDECTVAGIEAFPAASFVVTGVFQTPDAITHMIPVTPCVLVREDCFGREALDGAFMKLRLRLDVPEDRYSEAYWAAVTPVEEALKAMGAERGPGRSEKLRAAFAAQLDEGQTQLDDAARQLREARETIDAGYRELAAGMELLGLGKQQLDEGEGQLAYAQEQLANGAQQLREAGALLELAESMLALPPEQILELVTEDMWPSEAKVDYAEFRRALLAGEIDHDWLYENSGYNDGAEKLRQGQEQFKLGRETWYYLGEEYLDGLTRLEKGRKQLEDGERQLAEGQAQYDEAEKQLREKREQLSLLENGRWVVLNNKANAGYVYARGNAEKLASLSMTFSSIFLIVGALVIYATVGRMVEQQRRLIGATKALGLYKREIFAKYFLFASSATLFGVGIGIFTSWRWLQRVILNSYEPLFTYGTGTRSFLLPETALVLGGSLLIATAAVYLGCVQLLRLPAIALMQGASPSAGRKKARKSAQKTLYSRLILLNMRTDLRRVLVTVVSIAGGCLLMVVGFTLRYGISGVTPRQFGGIMTYEAEAYYNTDANPDAAAEIAAVLEKNALPFVPVHKESTVFAEDGELNALTLIVAEPGSLEGYYKLVDVRSGAALELSEDGALIPRRFWESYGIDRGQSVAVYDADMNERELPVSGVFENYYGQLFFLSPRAYEQTFGAPAAMNCYLVRTEGMALGELEQQLSGIPGFVRLDDAAAERVIIEQFSGSLNFVVWFMLFIAAMMACFIVANFTVTYLQRKTTELTIMRVNGFSVGECTRYAAVDLVVTTVLGTLLGLLLGGLLGAQILHVTETSYIQMVREPAAKTFLFSALITFGFSLVTNAVALRRVKKLKLSDLT